MRTSPVNLWGFGAQGIYIYIYTISYLYIIIYIYIVLYNILCYIKRICYDHDQIICKCPKLINLPCNHSARHAIVNPDSQLGFEEGWV